MTIRNGLALVIVIASIAAASQLFVVLGQSGPRLYTTWSQPGGSIEGAQYSALKQINKTNVRQLELQWFHPAPGPTGRFAFSPLVVDNVMYVVGKDSAVFALDAATGKELWTFATEGTPTNRGFNYWENADRSDRRIIFASRSYLQQLDARTGSRLRASGSTAS
jgi:quinoprotein glucose dehydrogenase